MKKRHPLNADGDFFVEYDMCLACDAPVSEAPDLMAYDESMHCYFKRQPQTPEETEQAVNAVRVSCIEAVLYEGNDPKILEKVRTLPCTNRIEKLPNFRQNFVEKFRKLFRQK